MKCRMCGQQGEVKLPRHNIILCREDFFSFIKRQVRKGIYKTEMLTRNDKIMVAVSGGKDSLVCWLLLEELGYTTFGLHIDLGIGEFSEKSKEKVKKFANERGLKYEILDIKRVVGFGIDELGRGKRVCSLCGLIKRYWLNRYAWEKGFTAVATGHNLDDEAGALLGNLLHWQVEYISRQYPVLPSISPKLIKRVKPLYRLEENEIRLYADLQGIDYINFTCPMRRGATGPVYKSALAFIEKNSPGTRHNFLFQFLEEYRYYFKKERRLELKECNNCGMPTTEEVCSYCKFIFRERKNAV